MAWTTPRDWTAGELVVAGQFNTHVRDNHALLKTNIDDDGTLRPGRAVLLHLTMADLDGSNPPQTVTTNFITHYAFDDSALESIYFRFRMPSYYNGETLAAKFAYSMASATSGDVLWSCNLWAISDGDAADVDTISYDANTEAATVPGTAGHLDIFDLTLANDDSVAAGDLVALRFFRFSTSGSDTASGDAELRALALTW